MTHELKIWPSQFDKILALTKTHEVRKFDRPFQIGDTLHLHEWNPTSKAYTGRNVSVLVTELTRPDRFGLPAGLCVMSIRREGEPRAQVMRLAYEMERNLRLNDHKGGRKDWITKARCKLMEELRDEVKELEDAVANHGDGAEGGLDDMQAEAADVANLAMMIADDEARDGTDKLDETQKETTV